MIITLYTNNSPSNMLSKNLTQLSAPNGALTQGTSLIKPIVTISNLSNDIVTNCNYAKINEFGRYYFVENIVSVNNGVWEITLRVDVLKSFETEIRNNTAVIKRQEKKFNLYLDDDIFKVYQNPIITTQKFQRAFDTPNFVLTVAGGAGV